MTEQEIRDEVDKYEKLLEMTNSPGWSLYVKEAQEAYDLRNHVLHIADGETLYKTQGALAALQDTINFKQNVSDTLDYLTSLDPVELELDLDIADEQL